MILAHVLIYKERPMLKKIALALLLTPLVALAAPSTKQEITHVIYITLDGVRWQDIFQNKQLMKNFWQKYAPNASIYGEPGSNTTMEVASVPISLPSYQSQMTGTVTPCLNNECGALQIETFAEKLIKQGGLKKAEVASISSWEVMDNAFEKQLGTAFSNHGTRPMHDPNTYEIDEHMKALNIAQAKAYPGDDTRPDKNTLDQALYYYKKYQPRFLWISFGDADDYAHESNLQKYHQTIQFYDLAIEKVIKLVQSLKLDRQTMIIITTDHGRGAGKNWVEHDETMPEAKQTWAFVLNGKLENGKKDGNTYHYSTLSIRPTVEKVFGID